MAKLKNLYDLFLDELKDIYSAEKQILKALPKMIEAASSPKLRQAFEKHLDQTKGHVERLDKVAEILDFKIDGEHCPGMEGLLKEGEKTMKKEAEPAVMDAGLIAAAQRVEHYEIAAYGTAFSYSELMEHAEVSSLLEKTLDEEKETDELLTEIAEDEVNEKANGE